MLSSRLKETRLRDGEELRSQLCAACDCQLRFTNAQLNRLLSHAALPKDERDPLELKHTLTSWEEGLGRLTLKQRKAVMAALEAQLVQAKQFGLPDRFHDDTPAPPPAAAPPPRKQPASKELIVSPTPRSGVGDGFTWTQSEAELTITVPVPEGTGKNEILLQMTPKYGPAQQLALRAKFWPLPLLSGVLHFEVDASESMWHLGEGGTTVVLDLPKLEEKLWP